MVVDKAFPDIEEPARERIAIDRFLGQLEDPQLAFSVRQKNLNKATTCTLEMQSHLSLASQSAVPTAVSDTNGATRVEPDDTEPPTKTIQQPMGV